MTFDPNRMGLSPLTDRALVAREYQEELEAAGVPTDLADAAACIRNTGCHSPEDEAIVAQVAQILRRGQQ